MVNANEQANALFKPYAQSPLHAFGLAAKARPEDSGCGVWMNELPLLGYIVVRGDAREPPFNAAIKDILGIDLPTTPSTFTAFAQGVAMWQSPDEWLLVCAGSARVALINQLEAGLSHLHAQVADNSGGLTTVYLSGGKHLDLLRHVTVYDVESLTAGRAVSTVCGKAGFMLYRHDEHGVFVVFRRSFCDYVWRILETAARPYRFGISQLKFDAAHPVFCLL